MMNVLLVLLGFMLAVLVMLTAVLVILIIRRQDTGRTGVADPVYYGSRQSAYETESGLRQIETDVCLEECSSRAQFKFTLDHAVILGRCLDDGHRVNDLPVSSSEYVSRQHLRMFERDGKVLVENLSRNGTVVNGLRVMEAAPIYQGDVIVLGDVFLRVLAVDMHRRLNGAQTR